jgi:hypothetical protein
MMDIKEKPPEPCMAQAPPEVFAVQMILLYINYLPLNYWQLLPKILLIPQLLEPLKQLNREDKSHPLRNCKM